MVNDFTHKIVIKEDGTQSLIIVPAVPKDSGEWTVVAQNRAGRTSVSVTLSVEGKFVSSFLHSVNYPQKDHHIINCCPGICSSRKCDQTSVC